ncbi:hypothetical protein Pst134EB_014527 [Puccinia striiformis f. sp. tritici]|nr:hypothetical protein Pst134EB_014527 [Puccinia striiformis f. sp. tritici]
MQSIQFLSVLVAVILHSQSATAIVPIFRCDGHGERTAPYCIQPGTETQYLSESYPFVYHHLCNLFGMQFIKGLNSTAAAQDTRRAAAPVAEQIYLSSTSPLSTALD